MKESAPKYLYEDPIVMDVLYLMINKEDNHKTGRSTALAKTYARLLCEQAGITYRITDHNGNRESDKNLMKMVQEELDSYTIQIAPNRLIRPQYKMTLSGESIVVESFVPVTEDKTKQKG